MKLENLFPVAVRKESLFIIPKGMMITGSVNTKIPGQIAGTINGNVFAKNKVVVFKEGVINGDISAEELLIYGRINGDVQCSGKILVQNGAVIKGSIITAEIHIEKDTIIEGTITKIVDDQLSASIIPPDLPQKEETIVEIIPEQKIPVKQEEIKRHAWF